MHNIFKVFLITTFFLSSLYSDSLKISGLFLNMDYIETGRSGQFLDSETSSYNDISGIELEYILNTGNGHGGANESNLEFDISYLKGQSNYDGFLQSTLTGAILSPYKSVTDIEIIEPRIRWSEIHRDKWYDVGIFVSLGYRHWLRDMSTSPYGFKEEYKWLYGDIGIKTNFHENNWHLGIEVAYQKAMKPTMDAELNGGMKFNLGNTDGYNITVPLSYDINKNLSLDVIYEYDNWNISASNVINGYYEPDSKTKNKTLKLGFTIKW